MSEKEKGFNPERVAWQAGGYAVWGISPVLARLSDRIAKVLEPYLLNTYPVTDGHVTLLGNIGKNSLVPVNPGEIFAYAQRLSHYVHNQISLQFTRIAAKPHKPSQALYFEAQANSKWLEMYHSACNAFNVEFTPPIIHASIFYNYAADWPLNEEMTLKLINGLNKQVDLPFTATISSYEAWSTIGPPAKWHKLAY
jgi:hypothetical protein